MDTNTERSIELLDGLSPLWWQGAIAFFLVGDTLTTLVGYRLHTVVEAGPVVAWFVRAHGIWLIVPAKVAVVLGFYALYRIVPRPHRLGVPLGLCALGLVVTIWNGIVIAAALL
ncbi:hypothetical protein DVK02_08405 [Halobellus sp. Atlit-31R]|nr:hypothetical protein DVK02_08405 [Halobellus sp. Atlit-31R]